jgi:hypothetical protein
MASISYSTFMVKHMTLVFDHSMNPQFFGIFKTHLTNSTFKRFLSRKYLIRKHLIYHNPIVEKHQLFRQEPKL